MSVKVYKPTSPGRRGMSSADTSQITTGKPLKSLTLSLNRKKGRNNQGRITSRHKGGGVKRLYRLVSFDLPDGLNAKVEAIEYDPFRSAHIARVKDQDGSYHYILAAKGLKKGKSISVGESAPISTSNRLPLSKIPTGTLIHNLELIPGQGAKAAKGAGIAAQLISKEDSEVQVKLPSGEIRRIKPSAKASIGVIGNEKHQNIKLGKAGRSRKKGIRPTVRGVVMNAVDHPHGGGDGGRHGIGGGKDHGNSPRTPWGQKTLGYKTRRRKSTNKFIVRSRHEGKRR